MKNKKIWFVFITLLILCISTTVFVACNKDTPPSESDFKDGDIIVKKEENTVTEKEYDEAGNEVRSISHTEAEYNVTYLSNDASAIYLKGNKPDEMYISGYDGDLKTLSVKDLESKVYLEGNAIIVKGVTEGAFYGCETLTTVDLEKGRINALTFAIGDNAFANCPNIATLTLPSKVYMKSGSIGEAAFANCESLTNVVIPDRFKHLGNAAFANCIKLASVTFNDGVTKIPTNFLYGCEKLASVTIPASVNYVGESAFKGCKKLTSITFPASVTYVGSGALADCISLQSIKIPFIGNSYNPLSGMLSELFGRYDSGEVDPFTEESYLYPTFPLNSSDINRYVPKTLTSVEVTNATSITNYAFAGLSSLTSLSVTYSTADRIRVYGAGNDYTNYDIPTITYVGSYAFANLNNISSFSIPQTVTEIGNNAFAGTGLGNNDLLEILLNAKSIGRYAFSNLENITSVAIPQSVTNVASGAFANNPNMTDFLSTANTALSSGVLAGCAKLQTVTIPFIGTSRQISDIDNNVIVLPEGNAFATFFSSSAPSDLYNEYGNQQYYPVVANSGYNEYYIPNYNEYYIPNTLDTIRITDATDIPSYAFCGILAHNIDIKFSKELMQQYGFSTISIGSNAFYDCTNLTAFTFDQCIGSIGSYAFANTSITSVNVPATVKTIGNNAFANCKQLSTFNVNGKNTALSSGILAGCTTLQSVTLPYIGTAYWTIDTYSDLECLAYNDNAFATFFSSSVPSDLYEEDDYYGVTYPRYYTVSTSNYSSSYYIPNTLDTIRITDATDIPSYAFCGILAHNITVSFDQDLNDVQRMAIGTYAFYGCTNLTSFTIDSCVRTIGNYAFANSGLESTIVPENVENVSSTAFDNCAYLTEFTWNTNYASVPDLSQSNITSITLGGSVLSIPSGAFSNMSYLTTVTASEVTSIGSGAFGNTPWLQNQSGAVYLGKVLYAYNGTITDDFSVDYGTVAIEANAFNGQSSLIDIYIPASVTRIGSHAFTGCTSLEIVLFGGTQQKLDDMDKSSSGLSGIPIFCEAVNRTRTYQFSSGETTITELTKTVKYLNYLPSATDLSNSGDTHESNGYVFYGWYENSDFSGTRVSTPYYNQNATTTLYARWLTEEEYNRILLAGTSIDYAIVMDQNQLYDVNITTGGQRVYFTFTPTETRSYSIEASDSTGDNYGHLYNSEQIQITADDDSAGNGCFRITQTLAAGETYYICARMYNSSTTGSFKISIT